MSNPEEGVSGTIVRISGNKSRRVRRDARNATVEAVVSKRVLRDGEPYRVVAAVLGCSISSVARAVDRLRGRRQGEADQRFDAQAALCRRRMVTLERQAAKGNMQAEQELRHWASHEAKLFGLFAPTRVELERVFRDRPTLLIAARLEEMSPEEVGRLLEMDDDGLRNAADALLTCSELGGGTVPPRPWRGGRQPTVRRGVGEGLESPSLG